MDFAVAFKRQDVRADAVEKITVVADDAHHAGKRDQRLLQHAQRRQVQIVRRFVEDEKIAAAFQNARQQQPAALAAGQIFHLRRDAVVGEQKPFEITAQGNFASPHCTNSVPSAASSSTVRSSFNCSRAWST